MSKSSRVELVSGVNGAVVIDHANQDYVSGWALFPEGVMSVDVFVDNRRVGGAEYGAYRADVSDKYAQIPGAANSGFTYLFASGDLFEAGKPTVDVHVVCRSLDGETCASSAVEIPTAKLPSRYAILESSADFEPAHSSPFPVEVEHVLRQLRGEGPEDDRPWSAGRIVEAVDDLILASEIASRETAGLFWYFSYLREMWTRLEFNARNFPALNRSATEDRKDLHGVATSPIELFVICHHLATLKSHGIEGNFCEFGCFKGFSTAALSEACFRLGMTMDVFDSFAGLPDSDSQHYRQGEFMGSVEEVKANVREFGNLRSVRFHKGYFSTTVDLYDQDRIACLWMDVDLELSAKDAMRLLPRLDPRSCVFSDECNPEDFVGGQIIEEPHPDTVIPPICDAFRADGRAITGRFVAGHTGFFRDEKQGIPALMPKPLLRLKDALLT